MEHALTTYRKTHGLSVAQLAALVETTRQTIYRIEGDDQTPSPTLAGRIQEVTGIDARVLLKVPTPEAA